MVRPARPRAQPQMAMRRRGLTPPPAAQVVRGNSVVTIEVIGRASAAVYSFVIKCNLRRNDAMARAATSSPVRSGLFLTGSLVRHGEVADAIARGTGIPRRSSTT